MDGPRDDLQKRYLIPIIIDAYLIHPKTNHSSQTLCTNEIGTELYC